MFLKKVFHLSVVVGVCAYLPSSFAGFDSDDLIKIHQIIGKVSGAALCEEELSISSDSLMDRKKMVRMFQKDGRSKRFEQAIRFGYISHERTGILNDLGFHIFKAGFDWTVFEKLPLNDSILDQVPSQFTFSIRALELQHKFGRPSERWVIPVNTYRDADKKLRVILAGAKAPGEWEKDGAPISQRELSELISQRMFPVITDAASGLDLWHDMGGHIAGLIEEDSYWDALVDLSRRVQDYSELDTDPDGMTASGATMSYALRLNYVFETMSVMKQSRDDIIAHLKLPREIWSKADTTVLEVESFLKKLSTQQKEARILETREKLLKWLSFPAGASNDDLTYRSDPELRFNTSESKDGYLIQDPWSALLEYPSHTVSLEIATHHLARVYVFLLYRSGVSIRDFMYQIVEPKIANDSVIYRLMCNSGFMEPGSKVRTYYREVWQCD